MSDEDKQSLDDMIQDTIQAYFAQWPEDPAMVNGFVLLVDYMDDQGKECWVDSQMPGQKITITAALAKWQHDYYEMKVAKCLAAVLDRNDD